ncbi:MAG TPA: branched-chain amino acid aminotransferase, partial [Syntrophorhabdaceae bacterium]|nr:branched-chain amino acid aminotransferase [Syntrophorhabdaceae bacterium]
KKSKIDTVDFDNLEFGVDFSDHMFLAHYQDEKWGTPQIMPYGEIRIEPSLCTLHYGQAVFEGLKAFRTQDGNINLFRPDKYHERFMRSNRRLCIPSITYEMFIEGIKELVLLDQAWVPNKKGCSLYIRPFVFATDNFLGVRVSYTYNFMIIASPVGAYYKEGINPVKLITSGGYVRAAKGGLGDVKTPANYAASLYPGEEAKKKGFTQVLWLDAVENRYIEEVGTMNIMFVIDDKLVTPPLEGSILPGVTRDSVIVLAKHWGIPVEERMIGIDEVFTRAKDGSLQEVFGTGTAAVISPVGWIRHNDEMITINSGKIGVLSQKFYDEITGIQYREKTDPFGWCMTL